MSADLREIKPLPKTEAEIVPAKLVFYCKNCEEIVEAKQSKKKFRFICPKCSKHDIAFGTEESIRNHYRIKDKQD